MLLIPATFVGYDIGETEGTLLGASIMIKTQHWWNTFLEMNESTLLNLKIRLCFKLFALILFCIYSINNLFFLNSLHPMLSDSKADLCTHCQWFYGCLSSQDIDSNVMVSLKCNIHDLYHVFRCYKIWWNMLSNQGYSHTHGVSCIFFAPNSLAFEAVLKEIFKNNLK